MDCPNCGTRMVSNYDEIYCLMCSYRDYDHKTLKEKLREEFLLEYRSEMSKCLAEDCGQPLTELVEKRYGFFCSMRCKMKKRNFNRKGVADVARA